MGLGVGVGVGAGGAPGSGVGVGEAVGAGVFVGRGVAVGSLPQAANSTLNSVTPMMAIVSFFIVNFLMFPHSERGFRMAAWGQAHLRIGLLVEG